MLAIFRTGHGNDGAAWAGGALVAGVAGFALWRLTRRRARGLPPT
jgi:LPXTG-motif cell wall-anchored protein